VPIYFAGLKPGASTAVEDISYTVINNSSAAWCRDFRSSSQRSTRKSW